MFLLYKDTCKKIILKKNITKLLDSCNKALKIVNVTSKSTTVFFKENFILKSQTSLNNLGLLTGYYEPELQAYRYPKKDSYPIYKINISKYGSKLFRKTRKEINEGILEKKNLEIAWVNNEIEAFFLQIQGSGRLRFNDGEIIKVRFAGSNKKEYSSIGKIFIKQGIMKKNEVSMLKIKEWLYKNKQKARKIMEQNERYIYFEKYNGDITGSAKIKLVPYFSIAVDSKYHEPGSILLIKGGFKPEKYFFSIAHDTGGAIKGNNRIDLFTGYGKNAEKIASKLSEKVNIWKLKPID